MKHQVYSIPDIISSMTRNVNDELRTASLITPSLFAGDFGKIVFLFYASKHGYINASVPESYLTKLFQDIVKQPLQTSYCNGLTGLCIGIELLERDGLLDNIGDNLYKHAQPLLSTYLNKLLNNNIDFLHGAVGIAFYFLRHIKHSEFAIEQIESAINALYNQMKACRNANTAPLLFYNGDNQLIPNISLSHGLSSVAILFSRAYEYIDNPISKEKCYALLNDFYGYLQTQLMNPDIYGSFTLAVPKGFGKAFKSRLAWCYGDIGVAMALKELGDALGNVQCQNTAKSINQYIVTNRLAAIENGVKDGGLCHGVSGIAQYLKSLSNSDDEYDKSIQYWENILGTFATKTYDCIEYGRYNPRTNTFDHCLNFLEGDSGIGMHLMNENQFLNSILLYNE